MLLPLLFLAAAQTVSVTAERVGTEPVLKPGPTWSHTGAFNPAVVQMNGKTVMLFRATDAKMTSRIGYAESKDGLTFTMRGSPVLQPEAAYEKDGGVEDPRLVEIDGTFYLTYTGYNKTDAQLCLATSTDLIHWTRKGVILPADKGSPTSARAPIPMAKIATTWAWQTLPIWRTGPMQHQSPCCPGVPERSIRV